MMDKLIYTKNNYKEKNEKRSARNADKISGITPEVRKELEKVALMALENYSNVHRGSGHYSIITTDLYEKAREIVLEHLHLSKSKYIVIFCSPS